MMENANADGLPDAGFVRAVDLVGAPERPGRNGKPSKPARRGIFPFSPATLWRKVANDEFPAPVKLSAGVTAWRVADVRAWLATQCAANEDAGTFAGTFAESSVSS